MSRRAALLALLLAAVAIGCANHAPSATGPSATVPSATVPSATAPSATVPSATAPSATVPSATVPGECPIQGFSGALPSNWLIDVTVTTGAVSDRVLFVFGSKVSSPGGEPMGSLAQASPPFSAGSSGAVIDVAGSRFLEIRFIGMVIASESGDPTFIGKRDQEVEYPALRQVTLYDESEGVVGWYVGFDGPGCATLTFNAGAGAAQLEIDHG